MQSCCFKACIALSFLGVIGMFIMLSTFKPDFLKNSFNSFVDSLNFKKTEYIEKQPYTKRNRGYVEPSAYENEQ